MLTIPLREVTVLEVVIRKFASAKYGKSQSCETENPLGILLMHTPVLGQFFVRLFCAKKDLEIS